MAGGLRELAESLLDGDEGRHLLGRILKSGVEASRGAASAVGPALLLTGAAWLAPAGPPIPLGPLSVTLPRGGPPVLFVLFLCLGGALVWWNIHCEWP